VSIYLNNICADRQAIELPIISFTDVAVTCWRH